MKRTRRESLILCKKLWQNIAEFGGNKESAYAKLGWKKDYLHCPACEFMVTHKKRTIYCNEDCIIKWPAINHGCMREGSPFLSWVNLDDLEKRQPIAKELALEIVALCNQALKALPPIKKNK